MQTKNLEIPCERLRRRCDPAIFDFENTSAIPALEAAIGQERAVHALDFGIDIESHGYHIFAFGASGTGKTTMIMGFLRQKATNRPVPDDWCYVHGFNGDAPLAIHLQAGGGRQFKNDMQRLVEDLKMAISRAFESEEYQQAHEKFIEEIKKNSDSHFKKLEQHAAEKEFKLIIRPNQMAFVPTRDGHVLSAEDVAELDADAKRQMDLNADKLQDEARDIMRQLHQLENEIREKQRQLEQQTASFATEQLFEDLHQKYLANEGISTYLSRLQTDVLNNLELFYGEEEPSTPFDMTINKNALERYQVNLLVDNHSLQAAPVIFESNPHYHNLIGRIEHEIHQGALVTNFMMIKAGALMRANGGYLVLEARSLLDKPFAWEALKSALKKNELRLGMMAEELQVFLTRSIQPESIPLNVRVVMIGDPLVYYLLYSLDEDFRELFKVRAEFDTTMSWDDAAAQLYARFIAGICENQHLRHFTSEAVALLVEESSRQVADQGKLSTRFGEIVDLIQQASYWASKKAHPIVSGEDIRKACFEKRYRSKRVEEHLQEMTVSGTILIDTEGKAIGQINGISVLTLGDYSFGKPSRITARTYAGTGGMVNIEREIELGGKIHNKGVLILSGYLGGKYAQESPLVLAASITFEQLYEEVEGDSASSAELYALLSSLSGYALRQDLAVTGSVNQHGQIQAIGGVNEKIEGFYDLCCLKGLSGSQGVIIPESNLRNLMLREDIVDAVHNKKFHIYAVSSVDEALELLTGIEAGELQADGSYPPGTVHRAVQDRLWSAWKAKEAANQDRQRTRRRKHLSKQSW